MEQKLTEAPVLIFPNFCPSADQFILSTDASATGIGAVLEQSTHVVQFRHYLLGRTFKLVTDHAPLQWLSSQKMEGLLARLALATQEFDFTITYCKGVELDNAQTTMLMCMLGNALVYQGNEYCSNNMIESIALQLVQGCLETVNDLQKQQHLIDLLKF